MCTTHTKKINHSMLSKLHYKNNRVMMALNCSAVATE